MGVRHRRARPARSAQRPCSRQRGSFVSLNGVGLSPDQTTVYAADTHLGRLWAFDIAEPGQLAPPSGRA
ncbi:hypothetical protein CQA20_29555, partial [Klebsiella pneumoniae]